MTLSDVDKCHSYSEHWGLDLCLGNMMHLCSSLFMLAVSLLVRMQPPW